MTGAVTTEQWMHAYMEQFRQLVKEATTAYLTADHLAYVTYPVVKESKMLAAITEKLYSALQLAVEALLYHDALYKRITDIPEHEADRIMVFSRVTGKRYGFDKGATDLLMALYGLVSKRRQSPLEFARKDHFFIASKNFQLQMLSFEKVKQFMEEGKRFMNRFNEVVHGLNGRSY